MYIFAACFYKGGSIVKYDSFDDYFFFILGASIAAGRSIWVDKGASTKYLKASVNSEKSLVSLVMTKEGEDG